MNLPLPLPSTLDDVDSLSNWMKDYQEYYDTHIVDEKIKKNFTFTLVKFINELTFALEKEGMGPRTNRAVKRVLEYLRTRDKDTGKPFMKYFKVTWKNIASRQVMAKDKEEALRKAILEACENPEGVTRTFDDKFPIEAEEVPV